MRVGEQPMFTVAVHAAPPHNAAMKKGCSWEGCALPDPPAGGGTGKPGFPIPLLQQPMFTLAIHAAAPHTNRMKRGSSWEGCALPHPPAGGGMGKPGFPIPRLRAKPSRGQGRGETWFPHTPAPPVYFHVRKPAPVTFAPILPHPPLLGDRTRRLPPAGGRLGGRALRTVHLTRLRHVSELRVSARQLLHTSTPPQNQSVAPESRRADGRIVTFV